MLKREMKRRREIEKGKRVSDRKRERGGVRE